MQTQIPAIEYDALVALYNSCAGRKRPSVKQLLTVAQSPSTTSGSLDALRPTRATDDGSARPWPGLRILPAGVRIVIEVHWTPLSKLHYLLGEYSTAGYEPQETDPD